MLMTNDDAIKLSKRQNFVGYSITQIDLLSLLNTNSVHSDIKVAICLTICTLSVIVNKHLYNPG